MVNAWHAVAGGSSTIIRLCAFAFLRWIPGHHFPPIIWTAFAIYAAVIYSRAEQFSPALYEVFPALARTKKIEVLRDGDEDIVEIVEVEYNDPVLYEEEQPFWKTLVLGIPDWHEWEFSYLTIGLNIVLALFTADLVFRGPLLNPANDLKFSRVGHIDDTTAKILFREPDTRQLPIYTYYKAQGVVAWQSGESVYYVGPETDFTHPITISGLIPETTYEYSLSNNLTGSFETASVAPSPRANSLTFLTSSCIKANFPYRPTSNSLAIHGFEHLSKLITSLPSTPAFMLFLGDFIYVDVPQRLSSTFSHYRSEYRRVYASPSWKLPGIASLPWLHTLDDHEIANDWSGGNQTAPFPAASDPFIHYHVSVNPPIPPSAPSNPDTNTTYFQFTRGPATFFMLDTRRYRTDPEQKSASTAKPLYGSSSSASNAPDSNELPASMLGSAQLASLLTFISTPPPMHVHWKFIASSVPFTKNWRFGTSDTWGGFLTERETILEAMHKAEAEQGIRIIILSGDRHEFAAIRYPPPVAQLGLSVVPSSKQENPQSASTQHHVETNKEEARHKDTVFDRTPQSGPHEFSVGPLSMFYLPLRTFRQIDEQDVSIAYLPDGNSKVGVISLENLGPSPSDHLASPGSILGDFLSGGGLQRGRNKREEAGTMTTQHSLLRYNLWIDGKVAWEHTLTSPGPSYGSLTAAANRDSLSRTRRLWS